MSPTDESPRAPLAREAFMCSEKQIVEFYRRAAEAGKFSEDSTNPVEKREFKEIERRWLSIAQNCTCSSEEARKPSKRCTHAPRRKR
jgi:hypothetical protein